MRRGVFAFSALEPVPEFMSAMTAFATPLKLSLPGLVRFFNMLVVSLNAIVLNVG